ncbi:Uncharacterised protein [Mycobacteroides abscessus subsp. abscessus]|nr:Uncharacterised protein [Mycobacteroides abscessus subsp. abscessus]
MTDKEDARRDVLLEELKSLRTSSESLLFAFDRVLNFGFVFAAAVTGLALANSSRVVLAILPFPIVIVILVLINLNTEGLSRAGHKKWVEEQLNTLVHPVVALEECAVAPTRQGRYRVGRFSVFGTQVLLFLILIVLFGVGIGSVLNFRWYWILTFFVSLVVSLTFVVLAMLELFSSYTSAYNAAKEYAERSPESR